MEDEGSGGGEGAPGTYTRTRIRCTDGTGTPWESRGRAAKFAERPKIGLSPAEVGKYRRTDKTPKFAKYDPFTAMKPNGQRERN